jgi:riboflavin kinase/FMN adenylyltransferase
MHEVSQGAKATALPPGVDRAVVTVGTFDGVHRGHRDVLDRLVRRAAELSLPSVVVSFDPHPLEIVNPAAAPPLLTLTGEKLELLANAGVNYMLMLRFTETLRRFSAEQFVREILLRRARVVELLIGYDHGFGRGRTGDTEVLRMIGKREGFSVSVVPAFMGSDARPISSTSVRRLVAGGDLSRAADALGRSYSVSGEVVPGARRGRTIGFPTINVSPPGVRKLLPPQGVYSVLVQTPLGVFGGMMNLGSRPTFAEAELSLEAHLFDAGMDLYGAHVRVDFVSRLRDTMRFSGVDELRAQLGRDEIQARSALTPWLHSNNIDSCT